jgi:hypothetical protein
MSFTDVLGRYFACWNDHDPAGVVSALVEGGTYEDPTTAGPCSGAALFEHVAGLIGRFPDVHFDVITVDATGETTAAVQWVMRGTETGPAGGEATRKSVALHGADFFEYDAAAARLSKVVGYFDTATMLHQLGLRTHISPADVPGRVQFGSASRVITGEVAMPGCFSVTSIDVGDGYVGEVDEFANSIVEAIANQPGYLGSVFATVGGRKYTFTAWRDASSVAGMRTTVHRDAMRRFNSGTLGVRVMASVWVPLRLNPVQVSGAEGERPVREEPLAAPWL